jgi:hypothetical protein
MKPVGELNGLSPPPQRSTITRLAGLYFLEKHHQRRINALLSPLKQLNISTQTSVPQHNSCNLHHPSASQAPIPSLNMKNFAAILAFAVLATASPMLSARTGKPVKEASDSCGDNVVSCCNPTNKESSSGLISAIVGPIASNGCLGVGVEASMSRSY